MIDTNDAAFLRSITTVHITEASRSLVTQEKFWQELLPTWTFLPHQTHPEYAARLEVVLSRINQDAQARVRESQLLLLEDVDRPNPNECLIAIDPHTKEVSIRIFGVFLTDVQSTSEWFISLILEAQNHFVITPHTRCVVALVLQYERTDLTVGRVMPTHYRLWRGFYQDYVYSINITAVVIVITLSIVIFTHPQQAFSDLSKFYGICERVLSAALMNVFLLMGQFYAYRKNRHVIEWEKP